MVKKKKIQKSIVQLIYKTKQNLQQEPRRKKKKNAKSITIINI